MPQHVCLPSSLLSVHIANLASLGRLHTTKRGTWDISRNDRQLGAVEDEPFSAVNPTHTSSIYRGECFNRCAQMRDFRPHHNAHSPQFFAPLHTTLFLCCVRQEPGLTDGPCKARKSWNESSRAFSPLQHTKKSRGPVRRFAGISLRSFLVGNPRVSTALSCPGSTQQLR